MTDPDYETAGQRIARARRRRTARRRLGVARGQRSAGARGRVGGPPSFRRELFCVGGLAGDSPADAVAPVASSGGTMVRAF